MLEEDEASRSGIGDGFRWLADRATDPEDVVFVYYSGHGSYAPDQDGDEGALVPGDEHDEVLVPWDAVDIHDPAQLVTDDSIRVWLGTLPTRKVTLVVDACYSGTITRALGATPRGPNSAPSLGAPSTDAASSLRDSSAATVITAARASEIAIEQGMPGRTDPVYGAFTYKFVELLKTIPSGPTPVTFDAFMAQLRLQLARVRRVAHRPQLEGGGSEPLLHIGQGIARRPFAEVAADYSGRLRLPVGRVHGITRESVFDVYGPDEVDFRDTPDAMVRVDSITPTDAYVSALPTSRRDVNVGDRAILARLPIGVPAARRVRVRLHGVDRTVEEEARRLPFVSIVEDGWDVQVVSAAGGPRIHLVEGAEITPWPNRAGVCDLLRRAYGFVALQSIVNPEPPPDLDISVRFLAADEGPPRIETAVDTLYEGRRYDLWMKVDGQDRGRIYASAAYAGILFDPAVVYPRGGGRQYAPAEFPGESIGTWRRIWSRFAVGPRHGTEVLRLYVGRAQYDFHRLVEALPPCNDTRTRDVERNVSREWVTRSHEIVILPAQEASRP